MTSGVEGDKVGSSVFWLAMPFRSAGRHEGMERTVQDAFSGVGSKRGHGDGWRLTVVRRDEIGRQDRVGRADEGGYVLFEIRWVYCY